MKKPNKKIVSDVSINTDRILKEIYWSKILRLRLYQYFKLINGFSFIKSEQPLEIEDTNLNNIIINLDGVEKNLTRKELKTYLKICLKSSDKKIQKDAEKFINKYQRLLNV